MTTTKGKYPVIFDSLIKASRALDATISHRYLDLTIQDAVDNARRAVDRAVALAARVEMED